ncbi:MAG: hypothetical protein KDB00_17410 [Planctomycetales bacterium]|nr:hypothetical protein [Planctomycetales bacterium]
MKSATGEQKVSDRFLLAAASNTRSLRTVLGIWILAVGAVFSVNSVAQESPPGLEKRSELSQVNEPPGGLPDIDDNAGISADDPSALSRKLPDGLKPDNFTAKDIAAANTMVESLHLADWLGPLAPVALSPFFGLACLSGLSIWGPDWLAGNALLSAAGPLRSQWVFGVFVGLTLLTSLPRLTKVSKPIAQALDQLETYSVIVILLVIKLFAGFDQPADPAPVAVIQFGVVSFTAETMLAIAMVINLFVINSVKFFFEVLIWLTPIPAVDAMFEIANKSVCAGLMALYAFSPTLATAINLAMLIAALIVFRWVHRRLVFYRSMLVDLFLSRVWKAYGTPTEAGLIAFVKEGQSPFHAKSRWRLAREGDALKASYVGLFGKASEVLELNQKPALRRGWIMHSLIVKVSDGTEIEFHVSRRYDGSMEQFARLCGFEIAESSENAVMDVKKVRSEFG